jgi:hypothetical protein
MGTGTPPPDLAWTFRLAMLGTLKLLAAAREEKDLRF